MNNGSGKTQETNLRINAALQAVMQQRDAYANQVVALRTELAVAQARLTELEKPTGNLTDDIKYAPATEAAG